MRRIVEKYKKAGMCLCVLRIVQLYQLLYNYDMQPYREANNVAVLVPHMEMCEPAEIPNDSPNGMVQDVSC